MLSPFHNESSATLLPDILNRTVFGPSWFLGSTYKNVQLYSSKDFGILCSSFF